jgi:16S rRNA processing protein RimM
LNVPFRDLVLIGRVVKPQGRKGEVVTEPLSDRPGRFPSLRHAYVAGPGGAAREVKVTSCWPHKGRFVLKLEGVDSIDAAEGYRGQELRISEEELAPLPEGSYYHHELRGLQVEDTSGTGLGAVVDLMETGGEATILVVRGEDGELLIPLAEPFVKRVDVPGGRLVVERPEYVEVPQPGGRRAH